MGQREQGDFLVDTACFTRAAGLGIDCVFLRFNLGQRCRDLNGPLACSFGQIVWRRHGWQRIGVLPIARAVELLTALLGPLRTYRAFAEEIAALWRS
jgi:hypothetical protein